jgi:hypothetical protein
MLLTESKTIKSTRAAKNNFSPAPLITRAALIADDIAALIVVPNCLAFAKVMDHPDDPFDYGCLTVLRPRGKNADQVTLQTIRYAVLCELKRFGGGININVNRINDGDEWFKSTYSTRAKDLGPNTTPVSRIFADAKPRETVKGAAHKERREPGSNVTSFDDVTPGYSKWSGRDTALAHADRYARLHAPKGFDIPAYKSNLMDLFAFHDELMSRDKQ